MALINLDKELLFIQVPATGSSVLGTVLRQDFGFVDIGRKHIDVRGLLDSGLLNEVRLSNLTVVATIRNPLDRWVTEYERYAGGWWKRHFSQTGPASDWFHARSRTYKAKRRVETFFAGIIGFRRWLSLYLYRARRRYKRDGLNEEDGIRELVFPRLTRVKEVIRYERLEEDARLILGCRLGVPQIDLPVKNVTPGKKNYLTYYDSRILSRIEKDFGEIIREFGYIVGK